MGKENLRTFFRRLMLILLSIMIVVLFTACDNQSAMNEDELIDESKQASEQTSEQTSEAFAVGGYTIDAVLSDWSDEDKSGYAFIPVQNGQSAKVYAKKLADGVIIAVEAMHFRYNQFSEIELRNNDSDSVNAHMKFAFASGETRYINSIGHGEGVDAFETKSVYKKTAAMRHTVFEIFVAKGDIANFGEDLNFGFELRFSGFREDYFWGFGATWGVHGCNLNERAFRIGAQGLYTPAASDDRIVIDGIGDDSQWATITERKHDYRANGYVSIRGFLGTDGAYLLLTATHRSNRIHQYWSYNMNFEIALGVPSSRKTYRVVRYNGTETLGSATIGEVSMKSVYDEQALMYTTVCEVFIPYSNMAGSIDQNSKPYVGIGFCSDECPTIHPLRVSNTSTLDLQRLRVTKNGLETA